MSYKMWLEDLADSIKPPPDDTWIVARSSAEAMAHIDRLGPPSYISFDFDLGADDTAENVINYLTSNHFDNEVPSYDIHSENVCGQKIILSKMESWIKAQKL